MSQRTILVLVVVAVVVAAVGLGSWWLLPQLLTTSSFMPHGHCYLWLPALVRLHVGSDMTIGLSYLAISLTLVYVVRKRTDLPFSWMFLAFGLFIVACGATHFMEVVTLWTPVYWMSGSVKVITAAASVVVAIVLPPLVPKILALPSPAALAEANRELTEQAQLLDLAHDAITVRSADGIISYWNHAASELYGYSSDEAIGKSWAQLLATEVFDVDEPLDRVTAEFHADNHWEGQLTQTCKDGTKVVVASRWALQRDADGAPASTLDISHDVTEQKRLEQQRLELVREREQARVAAQEQIIRKQEQMLVEMATPIIPITDKIVVMPLVGVMDHQRAEQIMQVALAGAESHRAEVVILDVTGMHQLDTGTAAALVNTANALRLLGARTILTGIRSNVAQMLVGLGVDLTGIVTWGTLQRGIADALQHGKLTP